MKQLIELNTLNIPVEHICCAISDKKCSNGYQTKKGWLTKEFNNGYFFRHNNERAKVFIEYGPAENTWIPITVPNYLNINYSGYQVNTSKERLNSMQELEKIVTEFTHIVKKKSRVKTSW